MADRRRRQYGTGSVTQRADGKWVGRIDAGYTPRGTRRVRSVVRDTEAAVKRELTRIAREIHQGEAALDPRTTVKAWCEEWIGQRVHTTRPSTFASDRSAVTRWIIPTIGKRRLTDLSPADIRKLDKTIRDAERSAASIRRVRDVLQLALKAAAVEGHTIPARLFMVDAPPVGRSDRRDVSVDHAIAILKAAETHPDRSRWVAALLQGMRQGECLGLTWERVDLEAGTLDVSWQMQELVSLHGCGGTCKVKRAAYCPDRTFRIPDDYEATQMQGRWHLTRPKTSAGERIIPLVPWMSTALKEWRDVAPDSPLVWPAADGRVREDDDDLSAWHALQDTAEVRHPTGRHYHLHEARHTTATLLMALGIDVQIIIAIMGQSSVLSARQYQHADLAMMKQALEGVAERLQLTPADQR